jgi:hypothetical protein
MLDGDWSSDVCSSDLWALANGIGGALASRHTAGTLILERTA